ncbi:MAG: alpha/beta fold hydrolase [Caldilineaceae bacterium]
MPYVQNNGVKTYYEVEGTGPALILLHGASQGLLHWREFGWTDQLKKDYQLILIDIRGHGTSDKPHEPDAYGVELMALDVLAVMDRLGIGRAHCCGFSLGGFVGFALAKLALDRFYSFVVVGSHPYSAPGVGEAARSEYMVPMEEGLEGDYSSGLLMMPHFRTQMLGNDPAALYAVIYNDFPSNEAVLSTMTMPCLICVGEGGDFYDDAKKCAEQLPNARFHSFPGFTHGQMLRYSSQVAPHVKQFLDEITPKHEKNRAVIHRLLQALNQGNFEALNEFYSSDWVCRSPTTTGRNQEVRQLVDSIFDIFRDAEAVVHEISTEDDQVTTRWTFKGTLSHEWLGIAPTKVRVKLSGMTVDRLQDGKITESSYSFDLAGLRQQLLTTAVKSDS